MQPEEHHLNPLSHYMLTRHPQLLVCVRGAVEPRPELPAGVHFLLEETLSIRSRTTTNPCHWSLWIS